MQHDMVSLTCPACQSSISVQLPLQLHDEQQQQQRRLQLLESQKTLLESMKILVQGRDADQQGDLPKAFQLYKVGLAMAIANMSLTMKNTLDQVAATNRDQESANRIRSRQQ